MSDAFVIVRDMADDASQHAFTKIRPSEVQIAQVDQPAEENEWHEKPAGLSTEQLKSRFEKKNGVSCFPVSCISYLLRKVA